MGESVIYHGIRAEDPEFDPGLRSTSHLQLKAASDLYPNHKII